MKYMDELEGMLLMAGRIGDRYPGFPGIAHPEPGSLQAIKGAILGHGEQLVLPDDCQFGDNDLCNVEG